jgi:acetylornithine/succinyldiaminopimelate/putrescine aminotransferase
MNIRDSFYRHIAQTSPAPLGIEIIKAEGVWLYGSEGERILDLISGIGVSNVGHRHPKVLEAIHNQLNKYLHTLVYGEMILSPQVQLAERLAQALPKNLSVSYFVNSGSEAIEVSLKLAKKFTGRKKLISMENAYHGSTHGALSITGSSWLKEGYGPLLPETSYLRFNNFSDLEKINSDTAAVITEGIQGEAGVVTPKINYLTALQDRCKETGTVFILDEIQSGFGRTGKLFALENYNIIPDIIVLAKGMGGGMPIGAAVTRPEIASVITHDPVLGHITTFGGHPVCCASSLACLDIISTNGFLETIQAKGNWIKANLVHARILERRGIGLWWAIKLSSSTEVLQVLTTSLRRGVLSDWFLFADDCIRISPPLTISQEELSFGIHVLLDSIDELKS